MKKTNQILIFLIVISIKSPLFASYDSLPRPEILFRSLSQFHNENADARLSEFTYKEKNAWMKWTPQAGVLYDVGGSLRPIVSFSLKQVYDARNEKEKIKAKTQNILRGSLIEFRKDSFDLVALIEQHYLIEQNIKTAITLDSLDQQILKYNMKEFEERRQSPQDWLFAQAEYIRKSENLRKLQTDLVLKEIEILKSAKY
jgi:hypothetical protein